MTLRSQLLLLPLPLLALAACGGSWSNRDLEFANALPSRDDLRSKLPAGGTPFAPPGVRRDLLDVGDPSQAYQDALAAQATFNGILDVFLSVLDRVRALPPTSRTTDSRTWGPYPDTGHLGFELAVTVAQTAPDTFAWRLAALPPAGGELTVVDGTFSTAADGGSARRGQGQLAVRLSNFKSQLGVDPALQVLDRVDLRYRTDVWPLEAFMDFTFQPGASSALSFKYHYLEQEDHSGSLNFLARTTLPQALQLDATARWTAQGAGRTQAQVTEGTYTGAAVIECWDTAFKVSYYQQAWPGGQVAGVPGSCPAFP